MNMKIGFYGATGSNDFGDYAMMVHNLQYIWQLNPCVDFDIYTPNKYNTFKNLYDNLIEQSNLSKICIVNEPLLIHSEKAHLFNMIFKKITKRELLSFFRFKQLQKGKISILNPDFLKSISSVDVLLFNGGGFLQHSWGQSNLSFLAAIVAAKYYNKPVYFLGCSLGPMGVYDNCLCSTIKLVDKILLRDGRNYTRKRIEKYGYKDYINASDDLLSVSEFYNLTKEYDNYIVIEVMCWIKRAKNGVAFILKELSKFMNYIVEKEKKNIVLICFDNDDQLAISYIEKLYNMSKYKSHIFCHKTTKTIYEVFGIYKYCDFSLSFKYHPIILALGSSKPCVGVICDDDGYYEGKMYGAFDSCDLNGNNNILHLNSFSFNRLLGMYSSTSKTIISNETKNKMESIKKDFVLDIIGEE